MKLDLQKRLAAQVSRVGKGRIKIDPASSQEIKEAITKADIMRLITDGVIRVIQKKGVSRVRAKKRKSQRAKGRQKGYAHKKGKATARTPRKRTWINRIRLQRKTIRELKDKGMIDVKNSRFLYRKAKGGFFRSKKHMLLYAEQNKLLLKAKK